MMINQISERVIGCAFAVSNGLGVGFLEKFYENALAHEIRKAGLSVVQQHLVDSTVLVESKHVRGVEDVHLAQCLNHLKATGLRLCLLLNFGKPRVEIRRISL